MTGREILLGGGARARGENGPDRPAWTKAGAVALGWGVVLAVAAAQETLLRARLGRPTGPGAFANEALLIALWALATPLVFRAVRRWPVRGADGPRHALLHLASGLAFITAINVLIRLPELLAGGVGAFGGSLATGLVRYGPFAVVVYGVIVAIGHALPGARGEARQDVMVLERGGRIHAVPAAEITWIEALDNYVRIHARGGSSTIVRERISALEARLDATRFVRIHRSALVALDAIREVRPASHGDATVVLETGEELRLTRRRRATVEEALRSP